MQAHSPLLYLFDRADRCNICSDPAWLILTGLPEYQGR